MKKLVLLVVVVAIVAGILVYRAEQKTDISALNSAVLGGPLTAFAAKFGPPATTPEGAASWLPCPHPNGGPASVWSVSTDRGRAIWIFYTHCRSGTAANVREYLPPDVTVNVPVGQSVSVISAVLAAQEVVTPLPGCQLNAMKSGELTITHYADGWDIRVGHDCL